MVVRFQVVAPTSKQRSFTVRLPILLGRGDEAKFRIQHDLVSRRHCELFERGGHVYVRDLGSTNGTFLNDEQVPASTKTRVPPGGVVRVGGLSFAVEYQPPASERGSPTGGEPDVHEAAGALDESRVEGTFEPDEEPVDFQVEHADDEPRAASEDAGSRADESGGQDSQPAASQPETVAANAEAAESLVADADGVQLPQAAAGPADLVPEPAQKPDGFDFLSEADASPAEAGAAPWPTASDEGSGDAANDASDDDQLNAFFKGLK